jgi:hypothetical protein
MENNDNKIVEVNLSEIDWNKLNVEQFNQIENRLIASQKAIKKQNKILNKKTISEKNPEKELKETKETFTLVKVMGKNYKINTVIYNRLKKMTSQKSKEKLMLEIVSRFPPIEDL